MPSLVASDYNLFFLLTLVMFTEIRFFYFYIVFIGHCYDRGVRFHIVLSTIGVKKKSNGFA